MRLPAALIVLGLAVLPLIDRYSTVDRPVDALAAVLVVVAGAATAARHRWPVPALLVTTASAAGYLIIGYPYGPILLSVAVSVYAVARHHRLRWAITWSTAALLVLLSHLLTGGPGLVGLIPGTAWVIVPGTLGVARRLVVEAQQRERAETERRIVDAERLRLAQEVHDVVGHGLAAIQMQADIALHLRHTRPEMAHEALTAISAASAEALDELRATLAAVVPGDPAPTPALARVGELCERVRTAGVAVDLSVDGTPQPLPAAADLAAYRVLQEALTNVVRHAARPHARVTIRHRPLGVDLRVTNQALGTGHADGFGITGMRRRVEHVGGTFTAGPGEGTFAVTAVIPREPA
ncbi:histidine kinase [Actinoplanes sp. NPDC026619]|uniref:sensor histidine kinase n=1 Tax=Actinoplanes sp. NPDC026619 TaxID=3155798 RepID=UPI0033E757A2